MESEPRILQLRDYQNEMVTRSLQGNVVVSMDTGSGKTHVALLRIAMELPRCTQGELIWFMTPTVELCIQQKNAIEAFVPAAKTRLLTGSQNVECWSEQSVWDAALHNVQVVVSTHAILADALRHGFVSMARLNLLIFDEAHYCVKKHPSNVIMQDFYHRLKQSEPQCKLPSILGLTASPIMGSKIKNLSTIEKNLDAVTITPRIHRENLMKHVHRPTCVLLEYPVSETHPPYGRALAALLAITKSVDSTFETTINGLTSLKEQESRNSEKTSLNTFTRKAVYVHDSMGLWASEYFVLESIKMLKLADDERLQMNLDLNASLKQRLRRILDDPTFMCAPPTVSGISDPAISPKVRTFLFFLASEERDDISGIVFVEQRVTTSILSQLLSLIPQTADRFRCAPIVGTAISASRRYGLVELFDLKAQREALSNFRMRKTNLMIATSVLEEGIDVQACNLVLCFDPPQNVKVFIQRRGRARQPGSKWVILSTANDDKSKIVQWRSIEDELEKICQQERRDVANLAAIEDIDERNDDYLISETTGAMLTADSAVSHLNHFCQQLPQRSYVDLCPKFSYVETDCGNIQATVTMPNCVNATVRQVSGKQYWHTERAAKKDAAFQAYCRMYELGLLNENLLPLAMDWDESMGEGDDLTSCPGSEPGFNIWRNIAEGFDWRTWHETSVLIRESSDPASSALRILLLAPGTVQGIPQLVLHWAPGKTFIITFEDLNSMISLQPQEQVLFGEATRILIEAGRSKYHKIEIRNDQLAFVAVTSDIKKLTSWIKGILKPDDQQQPELVRVPHPYNPAYEFVRWMPNSPGAVPEVECKPLPRRRGYQTPFAGTTRPTTVKLERYPIKHCQFIPLPLELARAGLFMPDIFEHISDFTAAQTLNSTLLHSIGFRDPSEILTAISAPSANRTRDYQRHEFVGDAALKFIVSVQLFSAHPEWHQGFLSLRRSNIVSNESLAKAALRKCLDKFIISTPSRNRSWCPPSLAAMVEADAEPAPVRVKLYADVVEAIIGAAYLSSTLTSPLTSARKCLNLFLPCIPVEPPPFPLPHDDLKASPYLSDVETLVGHRFARKALLAEALTHGSCPASGARSGSYERLEFLGDAVLDLLVVRRLCPRLREEGQLMSQGKMTQLRAAVVNADLLGYLCLGVHAEEVDLEVVKLIKGRKYGVGESKREFRLWKFLNHGSPALIKAMAETAERFETEGQVIAAKLDSGGEFPWVEVLSLGPEKVFSDMIESMLGAILVDTDGNLDECDKFLCRIGLMQCLDRMVEHNVDVRHPKSALQQSLGSKQAEYRLKFDGLTHQCRIQVGNDIVATAEGCRTEGEAVAKASWEAGQALKTNALAV